MYSYFANILSATLGTFIASGPGVLAAANNTRALSKFSMTLIGIGAFTCFLVVLLKFSKKLEAKKEARIQQEQQLQQLQQQKELHKQQLAQLQAYATPCVKCQNTALPVRGTRNKYLCPHCQHEFFASVHDLPHLT